MHEGSSEYGHYYSFIFDRKANKWYRFNDYKVSEESEEVVFREAYGSDDSKNKQCAYSLIYVNENIADVQRNLTLIEMNERLQNICPENYSKNVSKDNQRFSHELYNYQSDKVIKIIKDKCSSRLEKLTHYRKLSQQRSQTPIIYELINFNMYLLLVAKNEKLARWMLIN